MSNFHFVLFAGDLHPSTYTKMKRRRFRKLRPAMSQKKRSRWPSFKLSGIQPGLSFRVVKYETRVSMNELR
ncbi:hypothetical protein DAI22_03g072400 [Oryza sativa Japonica Group]|nr:hypothetical protein DAI22_03g072400 [Oryza sativa Japonica Group]